MTNIHHTAIVDKGAQLHESVTVGAYAVIGPNVVIGEDTTIGNHAGIKGHTVIGKNNKIFQFASVGEPPQDKKYSGEPTRLEIGDNNIIREFSTLHTGTVTGIGLTTVGDDNIFMAYSHVAHDCVIGNHTIFANSVALGGHVHVKDWVILGGYSIVHQFTIIGEHSMTAGATGVAQDIPPYIIAGKEPTRYCSINLIGLRRRGFSNETIQNIHEAYRLLYSKGILKEGIEEIKKNLEVTKEIQYIIDFVESSQRGIIR